MLMRRYAPLFVAAVLAGVVAYPFVRNLMGEPPQPMLGAQVGGQFTLQSQSGPVSSADLAAPLRLIYFGFTYCPDVCPLELARMAQAIEPLGTDQDQVQGIFVTVDPARDGADEVAAYARAFHPTFLGLTGSQDELSVVMRQYQVYAARVEGKTPEQYTMDHTSRIYLTNASGQLLALFSMDTPVPEITARIKAFL
ncbi:MAG: SCO family protein [Gammaproteobacteria bacterium]|nr:SCO family protein [Gammaproteobacteria bacterium]